MFESGVNMKRVLVVSDSHGNMGNLSEVIKRSKDIDNVNSSWRYNGRR